MALAPAVSGIADQYVGTLNVVWLPQASEQGRAAMALFNLPQRGVAVLDKNNLLVWHAASATQRMVETQVRWALDDAATDAR